MHIILFNSYTSININWNFYYDNNSSNGNYLSGDANVIKSGVWEVQGADKVAVMQLWSF